MSDNRVTHNNAVIGIILFRVPSVPRVFQFVTKKNQYIPRPAYSRQPASLHPVVPSTRRFRARSLSLSLSPSLSYLDADDGVISRTAWL